MPALKRCIQLFAILVLAVTGSAASETDLKGGSGSLRLLASGSNPLDAFGEAVSLSTNRALVGAPKADGVVPGSGAAFVFEFDGTNWTQVAKLMAADGAQNDDFGQSVSIDGDRAVVGAPNSDDKGVDSGSAYVFHFDGSSWSQVAELSGPDTVSSDFFGLAVDLLGNRILAGAPNQGGVGGGAAYVFDHDGSNWEFSQKLTPATLPLPGSRRTKGVGAPNFGRALSLGPDRALVGAPEDNGGRGSAYFFDASGGTWGFTEQVSLNFASPGERFGAAVSLSGDRALIGVPGAQNNSGEAWIYDFDGSNWVQTQDLVAGDSTEHAFGSCGDQLGISLSLWGDYALLGAATDDVWGDFAGSSYLFQFYAGNWTQVNKLTADDGLANHLYGYGVALEAGLALFGAPGRDLLTTGPCSAGASGEAGRAYGMQIFPDPANGVQPDQFEVDDTPAAAGNIQLGMQFTVDEYPQRHSLHTGDDEDWVKFIYVPGRNFTITARPRDESLSLGLLLQDEAGTEIDSDGCDVSDNSGDEVFVFPNSATGTQQLFVRVSECVAGTATGTRDYDLLINGEGHQQCVLLEGAVSDLVTGQSVPLLWLFSDINNTTITSPSGQYQMCVDFDIRELTTFDNSGVTLPETVDVIVNVDCAPGCIEPNYEDDDGNFRPRIIPGSRARLDFTVRGPVIFRDGFE